MCSKDCWNNHKKKLIALIICGACCFITIVVLLIIAAPFFKGMAVMRDAPNSAIPAKVFNGKTNDWYVLNDNVMGGKSTSKIEVNNKGHLVFSGNVNTDGGGFATFRTTNFELGLTDASQSFRVTYSGNTSDNVVSKMTLGTTGWESWNLQGTMKTLKSG